MNNLFASIFGLGNQEIFLISCSILVFAIIVWSISDLMSNSDYPSVAKLIWVALILFFPVLGALFYLYYGRSEKHLSRNK